MKIFSLLPFLILSAWASPKVPTLLTTPHESLLASAELSLSRGDIIIAEHVVNMMKLINKGYVNQEIINKLLKEVDQSKHFKNFLPFLTSIKTISRLKNTDDLIAACSDYSVSKEKLPIERRLERMAGNYCRERTLEAIGRDVERDRAINDQATSFIQENLRFFLTKKNRKNFAFFIQSFSGRPEILKKISQEVTTFSVRNEIVPSHDILKDIEINEQITKLIQTKGFNPLQHQNVFYAEYGKLIELGYRTLNPKNGARPIEGKIREHFKFLKNYLELNHDHLPMGLSLTRLNDFAKATFRSGMADLSRNIFKYIIKKNNKMILEDALFFYLWTYISTDDYKTALKVAKDADLLSKPGNVTDPRLRFWLAQCLEKSERLPEAITIFESIVADSPLSYYAIMSTKKIHALGPSSPAVNFYAVSTSTTNASLNFQMKDLDPDHVSSLVRLRAWAHIDHQKMRNLELKRINNHSNPALMVKYPSDKQLTVKSDLHLLNAKIIQDSRNYLATFRYLYEVLDKKEVVFGRPLLEILYPRPYLEELARALKNDQLDPLIVLSLIRQESVFNPLARSPVGARGLMQLMPTTAKRMRRGVNETQLANPGLNIELGTKYFKGLVKRYEGNLVYVLSAYNAGETRVERWKNLYWDSEGPILKNIEQIPFHETRNYVKLIFRNIFFYKLLTKKNELTENGELNKIYDVQLGFKR
jgi:soluble lytic murein transglycosylase